jgi:hypothetical protein
MPKHISSRGGWAYSDFWKKGIHYQERLTCEQFPMGIPFQEEGPFRDWAERALARLKDIIERGEFTRHKTVFDNLIPKLKAKMDDDPETFTDSLRERIEGIIPTLLEYFGGSRVIDIKPQPTGLENQKSIVEYKEWRERKGIKKSTLQKEFATLKKLLWIADPRFKFPTTKDTERMRFKHPGGKIDRVLRTDEVEILIQKAPAQYRIHCRIAAATMLSANDIVGPKGFAPCHICPDGFFRKPRNKSGTLIQFKVGKEFEKILREVPRPLDDSRPFFPEIVPDNMTSSVRKKFDRIQGYSWVTFRSFRDYGATLAHRQGVPPKVIQKILGQRDWRSLQHYIMTDDEDLREAAEVMDQATTLYKSSKNFPSRKEVTPYR